MLGVLAQNWKMVNLFMQHLWMLHDVVVVWPGLHNSTSVALRHAHYFDFQYPTFCEQGGQMYATCCAQHCCDMLC